MIPRSRQTRAHRRPNALLALDSRQGISVSRRHQMRTGNYQGMWSPRHSSVQFRRSWQMALAEWCPGPPDRTSVFLMLIVRPRFTHVRQNSILKLPVNLLNITTLLQGDPNISNNMNSLIFKAVQDFIAQSGRFAMEWQTRLNSYWHKSIFSLSLDFWLIFVVVFMLFNINIHTRCCKMNLVNYVREHLL